jgi:hypothetical protein
MKKTRSVVDSVIITHKDLDHIDAGNIARVLLNDATKTAEETAEEIKRAVWTTAILWLAVCITFKQERELPPKFGEGLLLLFCNSDLADAIAGDLQERFEADIRGAGFRRAKFRYWMRVLKSVGPLIFSRIRNLGLFAAALEYGRRKIGL